MANDKISDYVAGVAAKYLSEVDAEPRRSNQHEIGGLVKAGLGQLLGVGQEDFRYKVRQVYIGDDEEEDPIICDGVVTWYDSRRDDLNRSAEYRLYYSATPVTELMAAGDFFLVAKLHDQIPDHGDFHESDALQFQPGSLLIVVAKPGSNSESQLKAMFGLDSVSAVLTSGRINAVDLILPLRLMLENIGVEVGVGLSREDQWLEKLVNLFGGAAFPSTSRFSAFARETLKAEVMPLDEPDSTLLAWMEREESFFRIYERHLVKERLAFGFEDDVESFIDFSLSVQNRRKSRVGHAFEGHLSQLFLANNVAFEQGRGKGKVTENNSRPDFLFPSFSAYRNQLHPRAKLVMLGAKTSCKDRWRQVLSEADQIPSKHLITLEPAISKSQLEEMRSHNLQLVIPSAIQVTYSPAQRAALLGVGEFLDFVRTTQQ